MQRVPQNGFSLIELVVVLILIMVLAIIALTRLADTRDDALLSVNQTLAANLQDAVNAAHAHWRLNGSPGRIQNLPGFGDQVIDMSTAGWPIGINKGNANDNVGRGANGCPSLWNYLLRSGPRAATNASAEYQSYRHSGNRLCSFVQRNQGDIASRRSAEIGVLYNSNTGIVSACGLLTDQSC